MKAEELTVGSVVFDASAPVPDNRKFFKVLSVRDPQIGPWVLEQIASGAHRTIQLPVLEQLRLTDEDDPIESLVGCRVRFQLKFGSQATGTFQCVEYTEFLLGDVPWKVPKAFILDGEEYPIGDIAQVEVL